MPQDDFSETFVFQWCSLGVCVCVLGEWEEGEEIFMDLVGV